MLSVLLVQFSSLRARGKFRHSAFCEDMNIFGKDYRKTADLSDFC